MAPRDDSAVLPRLKPTHIADLKTLSDLLHLVFHRNKNQHRLSFWWRGFSTFRREYQHLLAEYEASKSSKTAKKRARARLDTWTQFRVPQWYLSFTHLISSNQFSAIGLVLLAILASVSSLFGITAAFEKEGEKQMQEMLHEFAQKDAKELFAATAAGNKDEDMGEVIKRPRDPEPEPELTEPPAKKKAVTSKKVVEAKKKKKKSKNAIDDLFAGL
ncbi:uncharacterized protein K452DRAFT_314638 [Aplosporella prunicola CBS 121167]|uniref:RNase MRP protein 1 RNA binding domain-containing protein n=1 Tax=Aplosporella prunicola CBS 121167 TaxID=1176127 RepID=A0A6A6BXP0_9PEZI|nr:uncharacterized protein K452DRAFT_314638 [Aplosporella prunicola CBS 121167]KAF2147501.1 hypothetical protein K452DRAFT_314638 [Aplosporella prunicola CBS 121167]